MLRRIWESLRFHWHGFSYNYHWQDYTFLFRGNIAKVSAFVPLVGYLLIFNDGITEYLTFENLAPQDSSTFFFSSETRLRFVYFGLIFLGLSEAIYIIRRPYVIKLGDSFWNYKDRIMRLASPRYFIEAHSKIRRSGFDPFTQGGKYYDRDYEDFIEMCLGARPGSSIKKAYEDEKPANWDEASKRFEPLLTGMMEEIYFTEGRKHRVSLSLAIITALLGYGFLAIPSFELFVRVVSVTVG